MEIRRIKFIQYLIKRKIESATCSISFSTEQSPFKANRIDKNEMNSRNKSKIFHQLSRKCSLKEAILRETSKMNAKFKITSMKINVAVGQVEEKAYITI